MKHIIQFKISKGDTHYIAESMDLPIVTQGKTLDEVTANIQEAIELHLQDEDYLRYELAEQPSVMVNFELDRPYGKT